MSDNVELRFAQPQWDQLYSHLYPGDGHEHAAVILATLVERIGQSPRLLVREVLIAQDGVEYGVSPQGHGRLAATFINRAIIRARNEKLVYLHVHNHGSDRSVEFSDVDFASHERGYPALLDITKGMPVGALVFGLHSLQIDMWWSKTKRAKLKHCIVVSSRVERLYSSSSRATKAAYRPSFDRQVRFLGEAGQAQLAGARVAVVGVGGVGSMVVQDLARLGVGELLLIDSDRLEETNLSRVVTAFFRDLAVKPPKTTLAARYARQVNPNVRCVAIDDDVAYEDVADKLVDCDFIFLCADTMRARLVVNAIVNQHLIPAVQVGSKILLAEGNGKLEQFYSVVRHMRPGCGCMLCNGLISGSRLAIEEKSDEDWRAQNYGTETPNPSVITLNGIGATRATHDFLMDFVGTDVSRPTAGYYMYDVFKGTWLKVNPRHDKDCSECSGDPLSRFARGSAVYLPCRERNKKLQTVLTRMLSFMRPLWSTLVRTAASTPIRTMR
jgi:molybdopterin/thiamine biosynthesis adenylyltransferase